MAILLIRKLKFRDKLSKVIQNHFRPRVINVPFFPPSLGDKQAKLLIEMVQTGAG